MRSKQRFIIEEFIKKIESHYRSYKYRKRAKYRLKKINSKVYKGFKRDFINIVKPFWKKYNIKVNSIWWKIYSLTRNENTLDPYFIPDDIWMKYILPYFSNSMFRRPLEDKNLHALIFPEIKRPITYGMNIAGIYYFDNYIITTKEELINYCLSKKEVIVKPSIDSGEGRLIKLLRNEDLTYENLLKTIDDIGSNYIIQEVVEQCDELKKLNVDSLNTIRVLSFIFNNEVHILSSIIRSGGKGSFLDNVGTGGYGCKVNGDGTLAKYAVNKESQWIEKTTDGILFENIKVPNYDKLVEMVKRMHIKLGHFKIIGWDIGIDKFEDPVLIEYNTYPGQNQMTCGPTFGNLTPMVLEEVFKKKTFMNSKN